MISPKQLNKVKGSQIEQEIGAAHRHKVPSRFRDYQKDYKVNAPYFVVRKIFGMISAFLDQFWPGLGDL